MVEFKSQRAFVRQVLDDEINLRTNGVEYVNKNKESKDSLQYRKKMNADGVPAEIVSAGYEWRPGTELNQEGGHHA